jgi:transcriptional repressor NrdR
VRANSFLVVKKDGRREEFSRDKLTAGIRKACTKRPIADGDIEQLVDSIEEELHQIGRIEVPSTTIGELVMGRLRELDRIAYIRFASVYREFADVESFKQEIDALVQSQEPKIPAAQLALIPREEFLAPARRVLSTKRQGKGK